MDIQIMKFNNTHDINYIIVNGDPWFRGKDVAILLEYKNPQQSIRVNVDNDDKMKLDELAKLCHSSLDDNTKNTIYINEGGLYSLMFKSTKEEATLFQ